MPFDSPETFDYTLIFSPEEATLAIEEIQASPFWAVDLETTSLSPKDGRVRLSQFYNGEQCFVFDHDNCGSFEDLAQSMIGPTYIAFMAQFEMTWFDAYTDETVTIWDVGFMSKARLGGGPLSLESMAKRDLKISIDKDMQTSNWSSRILTNAQLNYAAYDAYVTWLLFEKWKAELDERDQWFGFHVFNDAIRGNIEMEDTALILNTGYHARNIETWKLKRKTALWYFRKWTPESVIANINSKKQMSNFLKAELDDSVLKNWPKTDKTKDLKLSRDIMKQMAFRLPYPMSRWIASYIIYTYWHKYISTYGDKLITIQNQVGKIRSRFNIAAAKTGRYSSANTNLQNIPRKPYIRKAFFAPKRGNDVMVLADYSGIEVRVLAELSQDKQLMQDAIYGDVHSSGAAVINNVPLEEFLGVLNDSTDSHYYQFKELRNKAKVFTFRLTYGAGIGALALSLKKSDDETRKALDAWAERYPRAYNYRYNMQEYMNLDGFLPICDGRTVYVPKPDRSLPVAANYPIQGAAASVMYRAVYHVRNEYIKRDIDARMAATVHDELLSYAHKAVADEALAGKIRGMTQGWLDIFPDTDTHNLLEFAIGDDWSAKP